MIYCTYEIHDLIWHYSTLWRSLLSNLLRRAKMHSLENCLHCKYMELLKVTLEFLIILCWHLSFDFIDLKSWKVTLCHYHTIHAWSISGWFFWVWLSWMLLYDFLYFLQENSNLKLTFFMKCMDGVTRLAFATCSHWLREGRGGSNCPSSNFFAVFRYVRDSEIILGFSLHCPFSKFSFLDMPCELNFIVGYFVISLNALL